jgi:integrase
LRSADTIKRILNVNILPVIGNMPLAELHRRDVHRVTDPILKRGASAMAYKTFCHLSAMLSWAVERGYIDSNPAARMKMEGKSAPSSRFLSAEEIAALWPALCNLRKPVELALKLALVTGQRIGEVGYMDTSELDLTKQVWTIPPERSKNKHSHTVPLSNMAIELIEEARSTALGTRLLNLTAGQIDQTVKRNTTLPVKDWRPHDLRRTVASHMGELGFSPLVIGHVLNHRGTTKSGVTLSVYNHYDYAQEKRQALDTWAKRLGGIVAGDVAKVVPLHG